MFKKFISIFVILSMLFSMTVFAESSSSADTVTAPSGVDKMLNNLYSTVASSRYPCLVDIVTNSNSDWYYTTNGHSLVAYGIQSDKTEIYLADPLAGMLTGLSRYYSKTSNQLRKCCRYIIW